ncbi:MAG TPA: PspC domain-containing protein [Solirubrobacter sp.]|nr:PspC domain-containing protein [Solirubrobacter sp.]
MHEVPSPTTRRREGRWLGGVCAGLAARWDVPVAGVRAAFVLATAVLGLGVLVYVAAWLILPGDADQGGQRAIVLLAQACGALVGLTALAGAGAAATLFGFGWVVVALAGAVLAGALAGWARLGPAWALLPLGALVLPSVALAVGGLRIEPSTASRVLAPRRVADLPRQPLRSGLGMLTVDLRRTELPARGTIPLRIEAGVRRTLIALPHDRCVHVTLTRSEMPPMLRVGAALSRGLGEYGRLQAPQAMLFGGRGLPPIGEDGPVLAVDFRSAGGTLVVRDYPDGVDPSLQPDWPGYPISLEVRPDTAGVPRAAAKRLVREWHARRKAQERAKRRIDRLLGGPCTKT